jgi:hypothetical protein
MTAAPHVVASSRSYGCAAGGTKQLHAYLRSNGTKEAAMRNLLLFLLTVTCASAALAQSPPPPAEVQGEPISVLMFVTLGGALLIAVALFVMFLRKRSNRAAADRALNPNNQRNR